MGVCQSKDEVVEMENKVNKQIEKGMKVEKKRDEDAVKLLLLGAGESGKSTIFKQMQLIHKEGYTHQERVAFSTVVHQNCISNMKDLITGAESLCVEFDNETRRHVRIVMNTPTQSRLNKDISHSIKHVWNSPPIQSAYQRRTEFQLPDSTQYFAENIDRLSSVKYMASDEDILRTRVRTTGIHHISFSVDNTEFRLFDVGGQRSERRKWIHCFDNVTAVMFVCAISEYDQTLFEDPNTNRLHESLSVFREVCNAKYFENTSMILFLNKSDLFKTKIEQVDLSVCFSEYSGGNDYNKAISFITQKFEEQQLDGGLKQVFTHVTCATDTSQIGFVFKAVRNIILTSTVAESGLL